MNFVFCAAVAAVCSSPLLPQQVQLDTTGLTEYVRSMSRMGQLPQVDVAVVGTDRVLFRSVAESNVEGRFGIGGVSEALTAVAVLRLIDEGALELDARVLDYLPELTLGDPARTRQLTVRHLLEHRSGLPKIGVHNRRVRVDDRLDHVGFVRNPGSTFEAAGLDYVILGRVLEAVTGLEFEDLLFNLVLEPAGIGRRMSPLDGGDRRLHTGHSYLFGWPRATTERATPANLLPASGLTASASEVGLFVSKLLAMDEDWSALGWRLTREASQATWVLEGVRPGFHALVAIVPTRGLGIVVLANRTGGPGPSAARALLLGIVDRALGDPDPATPYVPWERVLHLALLSLLVGSVLYSLHWYLRWKRVGQPNTTAHTTMIVGLLAVELAVAAAVPLVVILGIAKMSIGGLFHMHPDLALVVVVFPFAVVPAAVWRTLVWSEAFRLGHQA